MTEQTDPMTTETLTPGKWNGTDAELADWLDSLRWTSKPWNDDIMRRISSALRRTPAIDVAERDRLLTPAQDCRDRAGAATPAEAERRDEDDGDTFPWIAAETAAQHVERLTIWADLAGDEIEEADLRAACEFILAVVGQDRIAAWPPAGRVGVTLRLATQPAEAERRDDLPPCLPEGAETWDGIHFL